MVVGSLLLILVAVATLGLGLVRGSDAYLIGSIAASLLAAIALIIGARQHAAARTARPGERYDDDLDVRTGEPLERIEPVLGDPVDTVPRDQAHTDAFPTTVLPRSETGTLYGRDPDTGMMVGDALMDDGLMDDALVDDEPGITVPSQATGGRMLIDDDGIDDPDLDEDPPDEPAAQIVAPKDAARVARMSADVLVIDGRPRYHQAGCVHLLGRESEPLPVSEAIELGFTPCSLCEPDSALLADARRV